MKQLLLVVFFLAMMLQVLAQSKKVTIHGVVMDTAVKRIEISYPADATLSKWVHTELDVIDGAFKASIEVPFPIEMSIVYGRRIYRKNYVYSDVDIVIDSAGLPHVSGSAIQSEYEHQFLPFFQENDKVLDSMMSFYPRVSASQFPKLIQDSINLLKEKYCRGRAELLGEYIKLYPDSYVALWDISEFVARGNLDQYFNFERLLSGFSKETEQRSFIKVLREQVKQSNKMQAGHIFPKEFFEGYESMLGEIGKKNRYYLVDFWYSHCGPCIARFPRLKEIYDRYHSKGFEIVSISVDKLKDQQDYLTAIQKNRLEWKHVWDKDGLKAQKFNINIFPTYFLLDHKGKIINSNIEADRLDDFLRESL